MERLLRSDFAGGGIEQVPALVVVVRTACMHVPRQGEKTRACATLYYVREYWRKRSDSHAFTNVCGHYVQGDSSLPQQQAPLQRQDCWLEENCKTNTQDDMRFSLCVVHISMEPPPTLKRNLSLQERVSVMGEAGNNTKRNAPPPPLEQK